MLFRSRKPQPIIRKVQKTECETFDIAEPVMLGSVTKKGRIGGGSQ
jgi:hypothetical protein